MKALLISRDSLLFAELASQGAARVPPLNVANSRVSMREALDRPLGEAPGLVIVDAGEGAPDDADLLAAAHVRLGADALDCCFRVNLLENPNACCVEASAGSVHVRPSS